MALKKKSILIPPDGGYGWTIVFASALFNFIVVPYMQSFGLIFKDTFTTLGLSATAGSFIISLNQAFGMIMAFLSGAILKRWGYRKASIVTAVFLTTGIIATAFCKSFVEFVISYGIIASLGMITGTSAYTVALNTFFAKKKGKAISIMMTLTGLGPIIMPQMINILMMQYTTSGAILILGAISAHTFISAILLQPIKCHMKREDIGEDAEKLVEEPEDNQDNVVDAYEFTKADENVKSRRYSSVDRSFSTPRSNSLKHASLGNLLSVCCDKDAVAILAMDSVLGCSVYSLPSEYSRKSKNSSSIQKLENTGRILKYITDETTNELKNESQSINDANYEYPTNEASRNILKKRATIFFKSVAEVLDLDLFKDPIYINILLGMSLAIFAEMNFSVLTAFILDNFGLNTNEIATFMSIIGITDIIFRFLAPYLANFIKQPPRRMYMISLFMLAITRFTLLMFSNLYAMYCIAGALGVAKGVRSVYMNLVVPTYVPLEKLASASGIQMTLNGIFIIIGGPIMGLIRDVTGSYRWCIVVMNCVTLSTILMWSLEMLITNNRSKQQQNEKNSYLE